MRCARTVALFINHESQTELRECARHEHSLFADKWYLFARTIKPAACAFLLQIYSKPCIADLYEAGQQLMDSTYCAGQFRVPDMEIY
jgi:hypothetical protein